MDFNINTLRPLQGAGRKLFIETYGCQMNVGDTEIVVSLMQREGYVYTEQIGEAEKEFDAMLGQLVGDEFDMLGIAELRKLLGGE